MGRDVDPNNVWRRHARCSVSKEYSSGGVHWRYSTIPGFYNACVSCVVSSTAVHVKILSEQIGLDLGSGMGYLL